MTEFDNTNRGVLFKNHKKEKDTHPDYRGNIDVNGTDYWISAWLKDTKAGKVLSLSVQKKDGKPAAAPGAGENIGTIDDEIPF